MIKIVAITMILAGLKLPDIHDPHMDMIEPFHFRGDFIHLYVG
jgi:hypothetical protein